MNFKGKTLLIFKSFLMLFTGWLTVFMMLIMPVAGGGASLILVVTVPALIGLSIILTICYLAFRDRMSNLMEVLYISVSESLLIASALIMYPYAN